MRTEREIRAELQNAKNRAQNSRFMFEQTGAASFMEMAADADAAILWLEWVLGLRERQASIITVDTRTGEVRK